MSIGMFRECDLVILGGEAGAFAAITEASGRGPSTALVNTGLPIGGTCVNVGCVPSKRLLAVGENAATPQENPFDAVRCGDDEPTVDRAAALDGTDDLVERFRRSNCVDVAEQFETDVYDGYGRLIDDTTIEVVDGGAEAIQHGVTVETAVDGDPRAFTADALFVATGVKPNSENVGLDAVDVETNTDGTIRVDEHFRTTNPDIYAAGDVIGEPELETVAAEEGNHAVKNAFVRRAPPSTTTPSRRSCSPARRSQPSARPNWSTRTNTAPVAAEPSGRRTSRERRRSRTRTASSRLSNTTRRTKSSAFTRSVRGRPT